MKEPIFTGAAVAIITPMNEDGSVNYEESAVVNRNNIVQTLYSF